MNIQTDTVEIQNINNSSLAHVRCHLGDGGTYESDIAESDLRESSVMVDQSSSDDRYPDHTHVDTILFERLTRPYVSHSTYVEEALMKANRDVINDRVGHLAATVWDGYCLHVRLDKVDAPQAIKRCVELSKSLERYPLLDGQAMNEYEMQIIQDNIDVLRSDYLREHVETGWVRDSLQEWLDDHDLWSCGQYGIDREIGDSCRHCGELYVGHSSSDPLEKTIRGYIDAHDLPDHREVCDLLGIGEAPSYLAEIVPPSTLMLDWLIATSDDPIVECLRWIVSAIECEESAESLADDYRSGDPFPARTIEERMKA